MVMKLQNAYDTISDTTKRRAYDLRWPGIRDTLRTQQESEKRRAQAAQAEKKRATEARAKKQEEDNARQARLQNLEQSRWIYDTDIFELSRAIKKLAADLKRLQDFDDEDVRKEKERNGWWAYLASPIYGSPAKETDEQKQERETKHLHRQASRRIKGSELADKEARLRKLQDALRDVNGKIAAEKTKAEDEKRKVEQEARARKLKAEQEARERAMREARESWMAQAQKERAERAAREAREAQAVREAQERARVAADARRKEAEERANAARRAEEAAAAQRARKARDDWSGVAAKRSVCRHEGWWPKVEGRQLCSKCHALQNRFALQCPGCKMVACAGCQKVLRGERRKGGGVTGHRQYGCSGDDNYDCDIPYYDYD